MGEEDLVGDIVGEGDDDGASLNVSDGDMLGEMKSGSLVGIFDNDGAILVDGADEAVTDGFMEGFGVGASVGTNSPIFKAVMVSDPPRQ